MSYEKLIVVGDIGRVDVQTSKAGNRYMRISVAVNRGSGQSRTTVWYSVLLFGKMVENVDTLLGVFTTGRRVLVEGRPQVELFVKKDGSPGIDNTIVATQLPTLLDFKNPAHS